MASITSSELDEMVRTWQDDFPVALLPIRIQVRFMTCMHLGKIRDFGQIVDSDALAPDLPNGILEQSAAAAEAWRQPELPAQILLPNYVTLPGSVPLSTTGLLTVPDQQELWVRFYPDDIHLQTHEAELTPDEYESGNEFWQEVQSAEAMAVAPGGQKTKEDRSLARLNQWVWQFARCMDCPPHQPQWI